LSTDREDNARAGLIEAAERAVRRMKKKKMNTSDLEEAIKESEAATKEADGE